MKILVNGRTHDVDAYELTYVGACRLGYPNLAEIPLMTVTYVRAPGTKTEGSLNPGDRTRIHEGTIFTVVHTGNA